MARKLNPQRPKKVRFTGNPTIWAYLEDLVKTGLYGHTPSEAAERLVSQGIEQAISRTTISRRDPNKHERDK